MLVPSGSFKPHSNPLTRPLLFLQLLDTRESVTKVERENPDFNRVLQINVPDLTEEDSLKDVSTNGQAHLVVGLEKKKCRGVSGLGTFAAYPCSFWILPLALLACQSTLSWLSCSGESLASLHNHPPWVLVESLIFHF